MKFILQLTNNLFNIIKDNEIVRNKYIYIYIEQYFLVNYSI